MNDDWLAGRFEGNRARLRAMAYRMLGSANDAEDALQEAWIHAARADAGAVANLDGWFTTIVARVCLDMLRKRRARPEEPTWADIEPGFALAGRGPGTGRARAAAPSRRRCSPTRSASRCSWCSTGWRPPNGWRSCCTTCSACRSRRSRGSPDARPDAARQLASRARRRVRGGPGRTTAATGDAASGERLARQRTVAEAFLAASRAGDLTALLAVLDPDVVLHADAAAVPPGFPAVTRGAAAVAQRRADRRRAVPHGPPCADRRRAGHRVGAARARWRSCWPSATARCGSPASTSSPTAAGSTRWNCPCPIKARSGRRRRSSSSHRHAALRHRRLRVVGAGDDHADLVERGQDHVRERADEFRRQPPGCR